MQNCYTSAAAEKRIHPPGRPTTHFHTWHTSKLPQCSIGNAVADLLTLLAREIADNRNWTAIFLPDNNTLHVSIKKIEGGGDTITVHPFGVFTFSERLIPLEVDLNKFDEQAPEDVLVTEEQFVIAHTSDMTLYSPLLVAGSYTEAVQHYNELVNQQPELKDRVQVLSKHELNPN